MRWRAVVDVEGLRLAVVASLLAEKTTTPPPRLPPGWMTAQQPRVLDEAHARGGMAWLPCQAGTRQ